MNSGEDEPRKVTFRVLLHYPHSSATEGVEVDKDSEKLCEEDLVEVESSANLSSLASKILQQLYENGRIEKQNMKTSSTKVLVQVRPTWKPLPLSSFVYKQKDPDLSLEKVFGKLLFVDDDQILVHLHLCNENVWSDQTVRDVIKKLLENYSQTQLERLNCPLSQGMLSQISRDQYHCKVSAEKVRLFGLWYEGMIVSKQDNDSDETDEHTKSSNYSPRGKKIVFSVADELPLLRSWFKSHSHPASQEMVTFAKELNDTEFRKSLGREKVDCRHINNWFKNERARERKGKEMSVSQVQYRTKYSEMETGEEKEESSSN